MSDPIGLRFVTLQATLFVAVAAGPWFGPWRADLAPLALWAPGAGLMLLGALLVGIAIARLGRNLTPFPRPRRGGELVTRGVYRHARHPIYGGVLLIAIGWSVLQVSPLAAVATALLWWLFERKSRYEERALAATYPSYPAYAARTRRFVPFLY